MNEAIQMFRDMPNDRREELYNRVKADQNFPAEIRGQGLNALTFSSSMIQSRLPVSLWKELNDIIVYLVSQEILSLDKALSLYTIVHAKLLEMGIQPAPGAAQMPPPRVPGLDSFVRGRPNENEIVTAAYGGQNPGPRTELPLGPGALPGLPILPLPAVPTSGGTGGAGCLGGRCSIMRRQKGGKRKTARKNKHRSRRVKKKSRRSSK